MHIKKLGMTLTAFGVATLILTVLASTFTSVPTPAPTPVIQGYVELCNFESVKDHIFNCTDKICHLKWHGPTTELYILCMRTAADADDPTNYSTWCYGFWNQTINDNETFTIGIPGFYPEESILGAPVYTEGQWAEIYYDHEVVIISWTGVMQQFSLQNYHPK